ncbi:FAD-dependent thymidylate synthase [bacterium]|nr:FAD-dependent thymidylate synthase [bacterium]MDB4352725.1 FAD-dependent thymidylate synthase [Porticoccaceae bacterium]
MTQIQATYIDHMGSDLSVVNAARVSFGKKSAWEQHSADPTSYRVANTLSKRDTKLVKYLAKHKHLSPFGHAFVSFHCQAPIYVARQLVKHKFLRWNEISRRYVSDTPEFYTPEVWRGRAENVKQGSAGEVKLPYLVPHEFNRSALYEYETLLEAGVCPEQARMVLPQSTMTEWYWSGSLDAFADMCRLRTSGDTQAETQEVAWQIYREMDKLFPVAWDALMESPH